eukprot:5343188-Pleurochrysis_carterae.AAC.1
MQKLAIMTNSDAYQSARFVLSVSLGATRPRGLGGRFQAASIGVRHGAIVRSQQPPPAHARPQVAHLTQHSVQAST